MIQAAGKNSGFTLWEITIVLAIMAVLFSVGLFANMELYRQRVLGAERDTIVSVLKRARSEAQNNINEAGHGVYFGSASNYVIFQGTTYASRNPAYDENFDRSSGLTLSGPAEVDFSPLDASSNVSGTISVSNGMQSAGISVNYEGMVNW